MLDLRQFPALVVLLLIAGILMLVPSLYAAHLGNWMAARAFLYHGVFFAIFSVILGLATMNWIPRIAARYHLLTLLLAYVLLPLPLAAPLTALMPGLGLSAGYFEMLSSLSTTGATLFDQPGLIPESVHLWRALIGWLGGLMILISAFAILAPLNLGGFEIGHEFEGRIESHHSRTVAEASHRILRSVQLIAPVYAGLTGLLALILIFAGDRPFVAICHAMGVLSTSGISPVGGLAGANSGRVGELALAFFLLTAVSHRWMNFDLRHGHRAGLSDPEIQLMLISLISITLLLLLRSFFGATGIERQDNLASALFAAWGSFFTLLSFLTTTGFESQDWLTVQLWSNLPAPGIILLGVSVMGGGIATTAGGVKLLRLYALYRHGVREMDLLIHPSSMSRRGVGGQLISRRGSQIAFVFLMLFLVALALMMIALSATGLSFEHSLTLAIASLTTNGPAIRTLGDGIGYADLDALARWILCVGMIIGRMECLVIVALLNPSFWRH